MRLVILFLISTFLFPSSSFSMGYRVSYEVSYMFFRVGRVDYVFEKEGDFYTVGVEARALGIARLVSGGRVEHHSVLLKELPNGLLKPIRYIYEVRKKGKRRVKYLFFMDDGILKVFDDKWRDGRFKRRKVKILKLKSGCTDTVSLYENIHRGFVVDLGEKGPFSLCVVTPRGKMVEIKGKILGEGSDGFSAVISFHSGILPFKAGAMDVHFSKERIIDRIHIKNVAFFGDLNIRILRWEKL